MTKKKKVLLQSLFLLFLIIGTIIIVKQQRNTPYQHNTGFIFGTIYNVTYQYDHDINGEILQELNKVDASLSTFNKTSIISQINSGKSPTVDDMFADVFTLAADISKETDGAFDITVAPLVNMWGFGFKHNTMPNSHSVDSIKHFIGYDKVALQGRKVVKKDQRVTLDCSAIAKGYGSDVIARLLKSKGIDNFMIEIGGEIVTKGLSEKRLPWKIGVTKPSDDSLNTNQEIQTVLNVTDKAMATSGNYRNFYYKGGKKYAHTIDPHSGYPVQHSLLSATVLANNCATADAYATAFMVMGIEKAKIILDKHPELMAYFIYADKNGKNAVWYSKSMKGKILE
ncbi:MAG: FAD:protein FMN transferase [Prevotella sp.]|nr:FAD:protein FMN transferase [Prevotella sp.]